MPSKNTRKHMPDINIKLHSKNFRMFFYWMYERQNIWYNRFVLKQDRPWTKDKILDEYKFTNVYRELDRNTLWLIKNVIKRKFSPKDMLWQIIVFRYFNKPELFEFMDGIPTFDKYNEELFNKRVLNFKKKHGRVFTDAYFIHPPGSEEDIKLGIDLYYCKHVAKVHRIMNKILWKGYKKAKEPIVFHKLLVDNLDAVADFLSFELYSDLTYTDWFKWDENDFVNVGHGAKFGLELIFPYVYKEKNYNELLYFLKENAEEFFNLFNYNMKYFIGKRMTLRTIEHSLCEFSKYWKMKINVGKPRYKFTPKSN